MKQSNRFYQGIACAVASANRLHDCPTICADVLRGFGITYQDLKDAGVEEYDLGEIEKILQQGNQSDREQVPEIPMTNDNSSIIDHVNAKTEKRK